MFFELSETDFVSYADGNTPYAEADNVDEVITILENDSIQLFNWFSRKGYGKRNSSVKELLNFLWQHQKIITDVLKTPTTA